MKSFQGFFRDLGLQRKLLLVSVLTTFAALLAALVALASYDFLVARPRMVRELAVRSELLALTLDADLNSGDSLGATRKLDALRNSPEISQACLYTADKRLFAHFNRTPGTPCLWPQELQRIGHRFDGEALSMLSPIRYEREVVGHLAIDYQLPSVLERLRHYGLVLGVVFLALFFGGLLYALGSRRLVTQPLLALSGVADRVTREQRYDLRSPVTSQDEVGRLAGAFNAMLATIAAREAALRRSQALLNNIVEKSSAVIYVKDLDGRYLMVNHSFRMLLPPGTPEPLGSTDDVLFSPEMVQLIRQADRAVLASGRASSHEETALDAIGATRTYISEKFPLMDEFGHIWAIGGVSTDITDRKHGEMELENLVNVRTRQIADTNRELADSLGTLQRAQDELVRSEKLAALGSLVAGVAHELNTPIGNSLLAISTMLEQSTAFAAAIDSGVKRSALQAFVGDVHNGSQIVLRNLHRAVDLVASFKQVAVDRATSQCRQFQLDELVCEILLVLMPTFKKSGIRVSHDIPPGILMESYPGPLGQVLINLVNNGLIHAFEGREDGEIRISAQILENQAVAIAVHDNGIGIAPENMGKIYDPFFTTKLGRGGSGLGLNIVYNIVYGLLGGRIDVKSALGEGTSFILTLPVRA
ncbi:ATP-binding protein [Pseudoduganella violaceinigra]|uniref:ATP-binding protein n=1 Tax=Pseudoduganella violaceinigra TaxID=246602 RepID=UPI0004268856|nr:ATP-binding protein [Pseudoduganella violaceinigra]